MKPKVHLAQKSTDGRIGTDSVVNHDAMILAFARGNRAIRGVT